MIELSFQDPGPWVGSMIQCGITSLHSCSLYVPIAAIMHYVASNTLLTSWPSPL